MPESLRLVSPGLLWFEPGVTDRGRDAIALHPPEVAVAHPARREVYVHVRDSAELRQGSRDRLHAVVSGHALDQDGLGALCRRRRHARSPLAPWTTATRSRHLSARGTWARVIRNWKHSYLEIVVPVKPKLSFSPVRLTGTHSAWPGGECPGVRRRRYSGWKSRGRPDLEQIHQGFRRVVQPRWARSRATSESCRRRTASGRGERPGGLWPRVR